MDIQKQKAAKKIKNRLERGYNNKNRRRPAGASAVLIPLIYRDGEYSVLFEVRASSLKTQPGEVCFPGGRIEGGETPEMTAVRETCEELLIAEEQVELIGMLDPTIGPSNAPLWAYIGLIHDYSGTFSGDEVDRVFTVPLKWFEEHEPEHHFTKLQVVIGEDFPYNKIPGGKNYPWRMRKHEIMFYDTDPVIWGLTARLLYHLTWMLRAGDEESI